MLVEIEPQPQQGWDKVTYEIASDTLSPTMTISSTDTGRDSHQGLLVVFYDDCNHFDQ